MKRHIWNLSAGFILILAGACSSAPPPPTEINLRRNEASDQAAAGNTYYSQGLFAQALTFFQLALELNTAVDFQPGVIRSYHSIGKTFLALGKADEAEQAFHEARVLAASFSDPLLKAQAEFHFGELALARGQSEAALAQIERALSLLPSMTSPEAAVMLHGRGSALRQRALERIGQAPGPGDTQAQAWLAEAYEVFAQARRLNETHKQVTEEASNLYMMASIRYRQRNWAEAQTLALLALEKDRAMENSLGIALDLRLLGILAAEGERWDEAAGYHLRSLRVYQTLRLEDRRQRALESLIEALEKAGRRDEAGSWRAQLSPRP